MKSAGHVERMGKREMLTELFCINLNCFSDDVDTGGKTILK
jgi:hypothetical protein